MLLIHLWDTLSEEQRACVDEIVQRNTRLQEIVQKYATAEAVAQKELADARAAHQRERAAWKADCDSLRKEIQYHMDQALDLKNRLSYLTQILPMVLVDWLAPFECFTDEALTAEFRARRQQVRQLLGQLGLESI